MGKRAKKGTAAKLKQLRAELAYETQLLNCGFLTDEARAIQHERIGKLARQIEAIKNGESA